MKNLWNDIVKLKNWMKVATLNLKARDVFAEIKTYAMEMKIWNILILSYGYYWLEFNTLVFFNLY